MKKVIVGIVIALLFLTTVIFGIALVSSFEQTDAMEAEIVSLTEKLNNSGDQIKELSLKVMEYESAEVVDSNDLKMLELVADDFREDAKCCLAGNTPVIYVQLASADNVPDKVMEFHNGIIEKASNLLVWREMFTDKVKAEPFAFVLLDSEGAVIIQYSIDMSLSGAKVSMSIGMEYISIIDKLGSLL